ncbi:MAG: S-layer homology domain-containing protein [Oscillospiraceae bacterium]|nr:S-layer homology domain-containing protein [Oscillospiraceae bacterium]
MKWRQLLALGLTLALLISLCITPAAAASDFTDVEGHWAETYITDMTEEGLFTGYEDGSFRPDNTLSATEALTLCARVAARVYDLDDDTTEAMTAVWSDELEELLGANYSWFYDEAAAALELGILTWSELESMSAAGTLGASLEKQMFSVYLVRAMGLNVTAQNLDDYELDFADAEDISSACQPYVYLLSACGVVTGDENGSFNPASSLNRAVSATMLSRALDYVSSEGLKPEAANYTDYSWTFGVIEDLTEGSDSSVVMDLTGTVTGDRTITVPADADISKTDAGPTSSALKAGLYARVCFDDDGAVFAVRLYDSDIYATRTGTVVSVSADELVLEVSGTEYTIPIDRFTAVYMGGNSGDRSLISTGSGYTDATVRYAVGGAAFSVELSGGERSEEGLVGDVTTASGGYTLTATGFDGTEVQYTVNSGTDITVNGAGGTLKSSYEGNYVLVWVSNDDPDVAISVAVDTSSEYIQGAVKKVTSSGGSITVTDLDTNSATTYPVDDDFEVHYEGESVSISTLTSSDFVTVKLTDEGKALMISAWPGTVTTSGTLTEITYASTTVLTVLRSDGATVQFSLDLLDPPTITRNGSDSNVGRLTVGDSLVITVKYQEVTKIEATVQSANATGVIESVTHTSASSEITLLLTDGTTETYTISENAVITQDDDTILRTALQPGWTVSMVVTGTEITSMEVEETSTSSSSISGTVLYVDTSAKEILIALDSGTAVTVTADGSTKYIDASTGSNITLKSLATDDRVTIYGEYTGADFDATLVVRA